MFEYKVELLLIEQGHPLISTGRIVHVFQASNVQGSQVVQIMVLTEREVKDPVEVEDGGS